MVVTHQSHLLELPTQAVAAVAVLVQQPQEPLLVALAVQV
jgi:hypothetical protein